MERSLRAQDELDGLPFKTMYLLEAIVTAGKHPEPVGQSSVVARMENPGDPSERGADVTCFFQKIPAGRRLPGIRPARSGRRERPKARPRSARACCPAIAAARRCRRATEPRQPLSVPRTCKLAGCSFRTNGAFCRARRKRWFA